LADGGDQEIVAVPLPGPEPAAVTVIENAASDAVVVPSDTLMTILE